jgi:uncharacterized protein (TIGR00369 family)
VYVRRQGEGPGIVIGLRVAEPHTNIQGLAHGGMLATVADAALGMNLGLARGQRGAQVTVSLNMDFLSSARVGDWLEAHVKVTRLGQRLGFAECQLRVGDKPVLRASAVFSKVDRPPVGSIDELRRQAGGDDGAPANLSDG